MRLRELGAVYLGWIRAYLTDDRKELSKKNLGRKNGIEKNEREKIKRWKTVYR